MPGLQPVNPHVALAREKKDRALALVAMITAAAILAGLTAASVPHQTPRERIPVLILSGENETDWRWTSTWLRQILVESGRFSVEITPYPSGSLADEHDLARFRVLVVDYAGSRWGEPAESNLLAAVQRGTGLVAVHAATATFRDWGTYGELLGLAPEADAIPEPFGRFAVSIAEEEHPITSGLGAWPDHQDALLRGLRTVGGSHRVLATARTSPESAAEPVLVAGAYGEGRGVATTRGRVEWGWPETHASQSDPRFTQIFQRAVEWAATGAVSPLRRVEPNTLSTEEREAGWKLLFDGQSPSGWSGRQGGFPEERWRVEGGCLRILPGEGGGDIIAPESFAEFELEADWRVDARDASAGLAVVRGGASHGYDLRGAEERPAGALDLRLLRPPGEFNHARVVARHDRVEHWENGVHLVTLYVDAAEWAARATGERALEDPDLSQLPLARIQLQDRGAAVWFRSIKIRELRGVPEPVAAPERPQAQPIDLVDDCRWVPQVPNNAPVPLRREGAVVVAAGVPYGYVRTEQEFHDFVLELDWRYDPLNRLAGESGILVRIGADEFWPRSIEIDLMHGRVGDLLRWGELPLRADPNRTNGYVTQKLRDTENDPGEWNHVEVRLERGTLTVLVNDEVVNTATEVDDAPGAVGLKVESVPLHYRNARITRLD